jgi:hypothetical protein
MSATVIRFEPDGTGRCLYTEAIDLASIGSLEITRASMIEYDHMTQQWEVKIVNHDHAKPFEWTHTAYRSASRAACLAWEHEHFNRQLMEETGTR